MSDEKSLFDPETFTVSSALNGVQGTIREALVIRTNYNGKSENEVTALHLVVTAPTLEKPRDLLISLGDKVRPSEDRTTPSLAGPFIVGGTIDKRSNGSDFFNAVKASGFPMAKLGENGVAALEGATFTWTALDKSYTPRGSKKRVDKVYDIPAKFEGFEGEEEPVAEEVGALAADVQAAVLQALEAEPEISRGQLSVKVGPLLKAHPQRAQALALLLKDSFLASIPGVTFDKKTVKKA